MSGDGIEFCDTNILVYAYDLSAGEKRTTAKQLVERLWDSGLGAVSLQVLQEFFTTLIRKASPPASPIEARGIVEDLSTWRVYEPARVDLFAAIDASMEWRISFWDAMILVAARRSGAKILWSEDLNDGQEYGGVIVRNPFKRQP
ncbi:MAG: PIN domain-containing protein [Dehalococcoidia bacterium]|nr:PIN domain-containing protein [Dehalococcoidia bacterium]